MNTKIKENESPKNDIFIRSINTNCIFKIDVFFTNYFQQIITIKAYKLNNFDIEQNSNTNYSKIYSNEYDLFDLSVLSPFLGQINSISVIYKEILLGLKQGTYELFEDNEAICIILSISKFFEWNYKIPFILYRNLGKNQKSFNDEQKNKKFENKNQNTAKNIETINTDINNNFEAIQIDDEKEIVQIEICNKEKNESNKFKKNNITHKKRRVRKIFGMKKSVRDNNKKKSNGKKNIKKSNEQDVLNNDKVKNNGTNKLNKAEEIIALVESEEEEKNLTQ